MSNKLRREKTSNKAPTKRESTAPRARKAAPRVEGFGAPTKAPKLVISGDVTSPDPELCALSFADRWTMLRRAARALGLSNVDHLWSLAFEHSQLRDMGKLDRWQCLARSAKALNLDRFERLWMLEREYSALARQDREHPQYADTLALARILKATIFAFKGGNLAWFEEQASRADIPDAPTAEEVNQARSNQAWFKEQSTRAKAYLDRRGADLVETRPHVADRLRFLMTEHLREGATHKDAPRLADSLLRHLLVDCRDLCLLVIADIPKAPTAEEVNQARRTALAGGPQLPDRFHEADLEEHNRRRAAFVAEVLRRDPWAFWPASMHGRCKAVCKRMTRVLLDTRPDAVHERTAEELVRAYRQPNAALEKTAEELVRACLRAIGYPEKKVRSLFAAPSID